MNIPRLMRRNLQITLKKVTGLTALLLLLQACSTDKETALVFDPDLADRLGSPTTPNHQPPVGVDPADPSYWIINGGVEDGVAPWGAGGSASLTQSMDQAYEGSYSLLVTDRSDGWHGPRMNLPPTLPAGTYRVSAWVRLVAGEDPAQINLTLQTGPNNPEDYSSFTRSTVTDSNWVQISGTFTHNPTAPMEIFLVYIESDSKTVSFYVDELNLTAVDGEEPMPDPDQWIINGSVEEGVSPWRQIGDPVVLQRADEFAYEGDYSLFVSGRAEDWHAAAMDLPKSLPIDREYRASVWVRMAPGTATAAVNLTLKKQVNGVDNFLQIASQSSVTSSEWVNLTGTFAHEAFEGTLGDFYLYIESPEPSASYYIDDLTLVFSGELIFNGDLETDTTGWGPFGPEVAITRTDADAYSGNHSLLVSNRSETWQGASFTFEDLPPNNPYEFSCWVKMAPGQNASELTLSLKTLLANGTEGYPAIDSADVTNDAWVQLSGSYSPAEGTTVELGYVQSDRATASYYIDNCSVMAVEPSESISTLREGSL